MSQEERDWLDWLKRARDGTVTQRFAAERMGITDRWVRALLRQWMIGEGIWESHSRKVKEAHPWRPRRSHCGELVQWDTSDHDWLEGRGEPVSIWFA
ncbi:MAG: hypothetical protein LC130_15945 [Bryobacterales bacterium]|nr:hypothetical protein [Bryobacterales bacterium]